MIKNPPANAGDVRDAGSIAGSGRSPGEGHGDPLQYSCLENPHGQATVLGVTESWTRLKRLGMYTPTRFTPCGCTTSVWAAGPPPPPETALSSPHPGSGGPGHPPLNHLLWALQAAQCLEPCCQATIQTSSLVPRILSHNSCQEEKGPAQPGLLTTEDVSLAPSARAQDQKWGEIKRKRSG